ncbi:MFS transporter [Sulfurovum sp. zt1-1]|uniref:MFS transporter n=1 Tax=Sulfurovum zhangzhouensis TaxID=3019067 RepID=A0ABT7R0M1_9BACT|nr:MFS transporter [Sulfurovum zhangzhouensis]MDM5272608.1 MFS transporter [Sulfurovum zhangzhouensis]
MTQTYPIRSLFALLMSAYYFFYFAGVGVYVIFMPKVLTELGYTAFEVGIIYMAAPFMRFLLPFAFRHFLTLTPRIYILSLIFTLIATILFIATAHSFWLYLLANLFFGAAVGVSLPYVETIALSSLQKSDYGKVRLWGSLGFTGIALWLGRVLETPEQAFYYLSSVSFITLFFGAMLIRYDQAPRTSGESDKSFSLSKYWAFWLSAFLMQVGFGGFYNFFTIYETAHGVSLEVTSWMWSFGVLCEIVMLYFQGPLLQRNLLRILQFAMHITALRWMILWLYPDSLTLTFASQSLHAVSFALYHTAAITYVYSLYTQKKLAQQFFLGVAFGLGGSVGAFISGKLYGEHLFLYEAIITLFGAGALYIHQKRRERIEADV